jgi:hypothetical protein
LWAVRGTDGGHAMAANEEEDDDYMGDLGRFLSIPDTASVATVLYYFTLFMPILMFSFKSILH